MHSSPNASLPSPDETHADGIHVERRSLLWIPIAAAGAALWTGAPVAAHRHEDAERSLKELGPLPWDEFTTRWTAIAKELQAATAELDTRYAAQLAALVARVPIDALPKLENGRTRNGLTAGPSFFLAPVVTVEFRLDPGAKLRLHNHPPQVVLTLCAEGETRYRHFEIEGAAPACDSGSKDEFRVRETRQGLLRPGQTTALTRLRDGIHGFEAGEKGARTIDFTLSLSESTAFSYLGLDDTAKDSSQRVYSARWLGKD